MSTWFIRDLVARASNEGYNTDLKQMIEMALSTCPRFFWQRRANSRAVFLCCNIEVQPRYTNCMLRP